MARVAGAKGKKLEDEVREVVPDHIELLLLP